MAELAVSVNGPGDIGRELEELARELRELPETIATEGAPVARDAILDHVRGARGSLTLSGLGATLNVESRIDGGSAHLEAQPRGAWTIADDGTAPHPIRAARGMPTPYGVKDAVAHPGARGARAWDGGVARADRELERVADDALERLGD